MSLMKSAKNDNYPEQNVAKNKSILKTLIEESSLICMPSTLWGVHIDSNQNFVAFSALNISIDSQKTSKSLVFTENEENILKINVFMNDVLVEIPYIPKTVSNVTDINNLLMALDAVNFCKYYLSSNNENRCLIFNLPFMDVCSHCFSNTNTSIVDNKTSLNEWQDRNMNKLRDITFNNSQNIDTNNIQCILCNKLFNVQDHLTKHYKDHLLKNVDDQFECTICLNSFNTVTAILEHFSQYHSNVRFIKCSACEKKFTNVQQLRSHVRNHTGYEAFTCSRCNLNFISKRKLDKHLCQKSLNRSKLYICGICKTRYATNHLLQQHQREHQIHVVPLKCSGCKKSFDADKIADHKLHCKKRRLRYFCKVCDKKFSCVSQRLAHTKNIHPLFVE